MNWKRNSTVILWVQLVFYVYPSNLKSWPEKNIGFETVDEEYYKLHSVLV